MRVCVLGAGIVGLATAYVLEQAGHDVTVIDRALPGSGASGGNGAQLSYAYVQPLADPAIWKQLPKLLLSSTSPLKVRPRLDPQQWLWALRFMAACNGATSRSTTVQLLALAGESRLAFEAMMAAEKLDCDFSATGKLVLYGDVQAFASARRQMALQQAMGSTQAAVDARRCVEIEPALAHYQPHIAGAIHTPGECAADCQKVCDGLLAVLRAHGVRFLLNTPIQALVARGGKVVAARTAQGAVEADAYVLALGAASGQLAGPLGVNLPVYPLKGYSITVDVQKGPAHGAPTVSVTDSARKVVFARLGTRLRVAGMAEINGYDTCIAERQIASLKASTQRIFPDCSRFDELHPWAGLRPATPTALPMIGRHAAAPGNLMFNVGHGALGFTLAFGSARRVAMQLEA
ncbi:D-amino-acid dehydrogenase [Polaromonas sp. CG_9.5]|uniref:D-amino acid dehydrogenase n=1 Tax=Polaromonas sp. CG_9.5 TaxID=3071705 RepID=UPI002DF7702C|nr:D-amino-acid dehydrogenase [Polaromonas sp. CG_9.5]